MSTGKKYDMLTDHPGKALLAFVVPMILGNLFQQFYNIADSVIVGRFVGEQALAAVGASYAITNVFIAIAIGGGIGSSVVISQFLGAGRMAKMKTALGFASEPQEVVDYILFMASHKGRSITGSTHVIDAGRLVLPRSGTAGFLKDDSGKNYKK